MTGRPGTAGGAVQASAAERSPGVPFVSVGTPRAVTAKDTVVARPRSSVAVIATGSRPSAVAAARDQLQVPSLNCSTVPSVAVSVTAWPGSGADQVPPLDSVPPITPCTVPVAAASRGAWAAASSSATKTSSGRT